MTEKKFREAIGATVFHFGKKENYTVDEIYQILEQHGNKIASDLGRNIEQSETALKEELKSLTDNFKKTQDEIKGFEEIKKEYEGKITGFETKVEETESKLHSFVKKEETRTATELLGGLVAAGAEVDVYKLLDNAIKEVKFEEGITVEQKQELIKPLVDGLVETKPYFKSADYKKPGDNKALVIKKKETEKDDEIVVPTRAWGYSQ